MKSTNSRGGKSNSVVSRRGRVCVPDTPSEFLAAYVEKIVADAPPMTTSQRARLSGLLRSHPARDADR